MFLTREQVSRSNTDKDRRKGTLKSKKNGWKILVTLYYSLRLKTCNSSVQILSQKTCNSKLWLAFFEWAPPNKKTASEYSRYFNVVVWLVLFHHCPELTMNILDRGAKA